MPRRSKLRVCARAAVKSKSTLRESIACIYEPYPLCSLTRPVSGKGKAGWNTDTNCIAIESQAFGLLKFDTPQLHPYLCVSRHTDAKKL